MEFTTILVNGLTNDEPFSVRMMRKIERPIRKSLNKKGILVKGEYYE